MQAAQLSTLATSSPAAGFPASATRNPESDRPDARGVGTARRRFDRPSTGPGRITLAARIRQVEPCRECRESERGVWAVDQKSGRVLYGKRCHCLRGQLLARADARRGRAA